MPEPTEIQTKIIALIANSMMIEPDKIKTEHKLYADLEIDSMDICALTLDLEEAFAIEVSEEDVEDMNTVEDVIRVVQTLVLAKAVPA